MNKPIVLLILKALEGRGAERMVTTLAQAYLNMDYNVHVLCLEDTQEMTLDPRVKYHLVPYYQVLSEPQYAVNSEQAAAYRIVAKRIDDYVQKNIGLPDLILANIYKVNWIMAYSQLPNIINVLHTALSKQFANELATIPKSITAHLKMVYGAHPCSCVSAGARQDLLSLVGDITKTITIYNPCDLAAITRAAAKPLFLEAYGLTVKQYIVHVGSFDTMKNHRDLLQAYAKTNRSYPLVLVGRGRLEDKIKQLAVQLDIDNDVKFLGFQANPYPFIAQAALLVLTSKFEGFGYVIVEAQALGVPVISTDCPFGPRELLPKKNLVSVGDIEALTGLMEEVIDNFQDYKVAFNEQLLPKRIAQQYLDFAKEVKGS